ncbi:MAG: hypothetical protein QFX34_02430, partial [Candidatus Verstraetearchaeota archaeon]|nr:hypothetical protein [Candidatus Verstraetearchaeota archaeon]
ERAVSPVMNVDVRNVRGGPSYAETQRMMGERTRSLEDEERALVSIRHRIDRARDEMRKEVAAIIRSGASR